MGAVEIMKIRWLALSVVVVVVVVISGVVSTQTTAQSVALARPGFHHLHMNSPDPSAAITDFLKVYPASTKATIAGFESIRSANNVTMLFTKVNRPPPVPGPDRITAAAPQTAFWHHVWSATDGRQALERLRENDRQFDKTKFIPQARALPDSGRAVRLLRRCPASLVYEPGRSSIGKHARSTHGSHRAERHRLRCMGRQAEK